MTTHQLKVQRKQSLNWLQVAYVVVAALVVVSITTQVFLVGLNVFLAPPRYWTQHINLGHFIGILIIVELTLAFISRMPARVRWLNGASLVLFGLQYNFGNIASLFGAAPVLALHAVNALVLFWCTVTLLQWGWQLRADVGTVTY